MALRQGGGQLGIVVGLGQVHAHEVEQGGETLKLAVAGAFGQVHAVKTGANQGSVLVGAEIVAPDANDAPTLWQGAVTKGLKQRRHEFAPSQIAGAAKENEVK